jgi:hypothetical protein
MERNDPEILEPGMEVPLQAPARPWKPGENGDYTCFRIRVLIAETADMVFSDHEPEEEVDSQTAMKLPSGGLRQTSYALFTEAMRKEALYEVLLKLQNDPQFERRVAQADPTEQERIEREIGLVVMETLIREIQKNAQATVREALEYIRRSAGAQPLR